MDSIPGLRKRALGRGTVSHFCQRVTATRPRPSSASRGASSVELRRDFGASPPNPADRGTRLLTASGPLTTGDRGGSSGSGSPRSRVFREPAFVPGARCNSWRPHGRARDQDPRVADDRWHTNASRRVFRHRGRSQMPAGGGNGRARSVGRRDVGPAVRRAGTTCPTASEPSSGPRRAAGRPHGRRLIRSRLLPKTLDSLHVTAKEPGTGCSPEHTHHRAADRLDASYCPREFGSSRRASQRCRSADDGSEGPGPAVRTGPSLSRYCS